jgi:hypothetical protein
MAGFVVVAGRAVQEQSGKSFAKVAVLDMRIELAIVLEARKGQAEAEEAPNRELGCAVDQESVVALLVKPQLQ